MGKYGYDETQYLSTEAEAIDKDGFHKKVDTSNGSSDIDDIFGTHCYGSSFVRIFKIDDENSTDSIEYRQLMRLVWTSSQLYFYFGEPVDDAEITFVKDNSESYYIASNAATLLNSPGFIDNKINNITIVFGKYMLTQMIILSQTSSQQILPFDRGEKVNLVFVNSEGFTQYTNANEL